MPLNVDDLSTEELRAIAAAAIGYGYVERRWWCDYCDTYYAEYVNGCPRCRFGEPGTSTSVRNVLAIEYKGKWHRIKEAHDGTKKD